MKAIILSLCAIVAACCMSMPDKDDYAGRPHACLDFDRCLYYNQKNPDKSVCADYAKECRARDRYEYCKDDTNRAPGMDFEKCWLYLNQK